MINWYLSQNCKIMSHFHKSLHQNLPPSAGSLKKMKLSISSGTGKLRVSELLNSVTSHHSLKWPRASREFWAALSQHSLLYLAFSNLRLKPLKLFEFLKCFFISETNIYSHSITAVSFHSLSKLWVCFHWCVSFKLTFIDLRRVRFLTSTCR